MEGCIMAIRDLVPWNQAGQGMTVRSKDESPFYSLQREMNRIFDDFFRSFSDMTPAAWGEQHLGSYMPRLDVTETEKTINVTAELPGMSEKDIEVSLASNGQMLTLRGEKKQEHEEKGRGYYHAERSFGAFNRTIALPCAVVANKVEANFKDGVLQINLPKQAAQKEGAKKIPVKTS